MAVSYTDTFLFRAFEFDSLWVTASSCPSTLTYLIPFRWTEIIQGWHLWKNFSCIKPKNTGNSRSAFLYTARWYCLKKVHWRLAFICNWVLWECRPSFYAFHSTGVRKRDKKREERGREKKEERGRKEGVEGGRQGERDRRRRGGRREEGREKGRKAGIFVCQDNSNSEVLRTILKLTLKLKWLAALVLFIVWIMMQLCPQLSNALYLQ